MDKKNVKSPTEPLVEKVVLKRRSDPELVQQLAARIGILEASHRKLEKHLHDLAEQTLRGVNLISPRLQTLETEFERMFGSSGLGSGEAPDSGPHMEVPDDVGWRYLTKKDCAGVLPRLEELEKRLTRISGLVEVQVPDQKGH